MVRQDPQLQKKAKPGEIAIRGDVKPDEVKQGEVIGEANARWREGLKDPRLGRLPDPGTAGIFHDDGPED